MAIAENRIVESISMTSGTAAMLIRICRVLPERLAGAFYYRFLKGKCRLAQNGHNHGPMRYAAGCHIRLPQSEDYMYEAIYCTGFFESPTSRLIRKAGLNGGMFCDVGANIGYMSLVWLAASEANKAVLIEADETLAALAEGNMALNSYATRAAIHCIAAGDKTGIMPFKTQGDGVTGWGRFCQNGNCEVQVVKLDDLLTLGEAPSFLKIDVEGAEPLVLRGGKRVLARSTLKTVLFEFNVPGSMEMGLDPNESVRILSDAGFQITALEKGKPITNWLAERP